jgi:hypothetical protein
VPPKTIKTAEGELQFPDVMDADTRRRYDEASVLFDQQTNSLVEEAAKSERLTKDDFAIRINTK